MLVDSALFPLFIFSMRVADSTLGTVRLIFLTRDWRWAAMALAFIEALIFALATAGVLATLSQNVVNLMAYCLGYATGSYLGMVLEARFVTSYVIVRLVARNGSSGDALADLIRQLGHGVTEVEALGGGGEVTLLHSVMRRQDVNPLLNAVHRAFPHTFVTLEEARTVRRGWMRAVRNQR
jgi:uncharacterized protein YebE (UPF0316 family)